MIQNHPKTSKTWKVIVIGETDAADAQEPQDTWPRPPMATPSVTSQKIQVGSQSVQRRPGNTFQNLGICDNV